MHLILPMPTRINRMYVLTSRGVRLSEAVRLYKSDVAMLAYNQGARPLQGNVALSVRVYRGRRAGDVDAYLKVLMDALQGVAYENDAQVVELHVYNCYDKSQPRVELEIEEAER